MRALWLIAVAGCGETALPIDVTDKPAPDCTKAPAATGMQLFSSGLVMGTRASIPLQTSAEGDLVIASIAYAGDSRFFPEVSVGDGTETLQIAMSSNPCGKWGVDWAVGKIGASTSSLEVTSNQPGTFVLFVARFSGLPAEMGAAPGRWGWSMAASGADVEACPGAAIVTTAISCGDLALASESPFTSIDNVQGMAAAAYVPAEYGRYGGSWMTDAESSSMTIAFP